MNLQKKEPISAIAKTTLIVLFSVLLATAEAVASMPPPDGDSTDQWPVVLSWTGSADSYDIYIGTSEASVSSAKKYSDSDGDINNSGQTDILDLSILADQWLTSGSETASADIKFDGNVDFEDFSILAEDWQKDAVLDPDPEYKGNQTDTFYTDTSLSEGIYYWRVDEVNGTDIQKGSVQSFTVTRPRDLHSDTWVAVDALNRVLPSYEQCGPPRSDRKVALFYYIWLGQHDGSLGPYDITKLLAANPTDPAWGPESVFHHWGESELGYYRSEDPYVIRKHAHMLANAGVDVIIFDITNWPTYKSNYLAVCSVFSDIRAEGGTTPQIAFMTNWDADGHVQSVYDNLYAPGLYSDLWFYWKGKPLILSPLQGMDDPAGGTINHSLTIRNFFTMRYSWTWMNVTEADVWKWMDFYPQQYGWHESSLVPEQVSVSCGMVPHGGGVGRSYHNGTQPTPDMYGLTGTEDQGLMFAEQWSRLNQIDPELVFITQWNEWVAERQIYSGSGYPTHFIGNPLSAGDTWFIDEFNQEFSRDIEPMKGGHTDNYYYQMIDGIRHYKGVRPPQATSSLKTITIDGNFGDWLDVEPEYRDNIADTTHRNHSGWGSSGTYVNNTGRNDLVNAKVARDDTYVYFYIETASDITSWEDPKWMWLFINADQDYSDGWEGYDYLINKNVNSSTSTTLKSTSGGWNWTDVNTNITYQVSGSQMEIRVPRSDIGQGGGLDPVAFDFKWSDNIQNDDDIIEFSVSGDSAPDRRFNYRYDSEVKELIPGIYNTGVDDNSIALGDRVQDPHWTLTSSADPSYDGPETYTVKSDAYPLPPDGPWIDNTSISKWICPRQNATEINPGTYVYRLQFDLTGYDPSNVEVTGRYSVDDTLSSIKINGVSTGISGSGFNSWHSFAINSGFVAGTNTLEFFVNNGGTSANPCGFRVELQATTGP